MFAKIARSWTFAKIAYGMIWDNKQLLLFPILSTIATLIVLATYIAGLFGFGIIEHVEGEMLVSNEGVLYAALFLFYFCTYFVIVFFNSALAACALQFMKGEEPTLNAGLSIAMKRLPQILAWAALSAVIGVVLQAIENANEKVGAFVASLLGTAWTVLTFFVVPVIIVEGAYPVTAIKSSGATLKKMWGEAFAGNFSLGILAFLVTAPVLVLLFVLGMWAAGAENMAVVIFAVIAGVCAILVAGAFTSAAGLVFKVLLYQHATGSSIPEGIDTALFDDAFKAKAA